MTGDPTESGAGSGFSPRRATAEDAQAIGAVFDAAVRELRMTKTL